MVDETTPSESSPGGETFADNSDATYAQDLSPGDPLKGVAGGPLPKVVTRHGNFLTSEYLTTTKKEEKFLIGQITRCGCTEEQKAAPDFHAKRNVACHQPRVIEPEMELAYWHPSMLRRTTRRLLRLFNHPKGVS